MFWQLVDEAQEQQQAQDSALRESGEHLAPWTGLLFHNNVLATIQKERLDPAVYWSIYPIVLEHVEKALMRDSV